MKVLRDALQRAADSRLRARAVQHCRSTGTNLAFELDSFFGAVAAAVSLGDEAGGAEARPTIEREPGTTLRVQAHDLEDGRHGIGYRVRIVGGRYRGIVGYVHEVEDDTVTIRTGDPAEWRAWDAR